MNVRAITSAPRPALARKTCGERQCPVAVKSLWAAAHLAIARWDEFQQHPGDPDLRNMVTHHMDLLRAAAKTAEPVMEVRLDATHAVQLPDTPAAA